jgi:hypothetical protein
MVKYSKDCTGIEGPFTTDVFYTDDETGKAMRCRFSDDTFLEALATASNYVKVGESVVEVKRNGHRVFYFDPALPELVL